MKARETQTYKACRNFLKENIREFYLSDEEVIMLRPKDVITSKSVIKAIKGDNLWNILRGALAYSRDFRRGDYIPQLVKEIQEESH